MIENGSQVLRVRDLRVVRSATGADIVSGVGFALNAGEILGLVGESGSGKTTAGLALLGYCRPGLAIAPESQVTVAGQQILEADEQCLREFRGRTVSFVPQDPGTALNPALRIRTQLSECHRGGERPSDGDLAALLDEVKLPATYAFLSRFPHQMSGGQQQRVAIAMAFATRPRVIVMDEPTTGLDVSTQAHILTIIRQLCQRHGVSIVYITHDLAVVAELAHRIAVMYAGHIVEEGPVSKVLGSPAHPYTRALIRAVPILGSDEMLQGIPGQAPGPHVRPAGCSFAPRCQFAVQHCRDVEPATRPIDDTHTARCHTPLLAAADDDFKVARGRKPSGEPLLEIESLSARHGQVQVLHDVNLKVDEGSCLAIVGESGSGKTTLARCIAGLHDRFEGTMKFSGVALAASGASRPREARRRIQYIFQNPYASLNPRRTVGESIAATLRTLEAVPDQEIRQRIARVLELVALPAATAALYPRQLSGGQRQRVAIARALIVKPKLLICDEITSALDVSIQAIIVSLIDRLKSEHGLSVIFVTHNLALIGSIAEQVAVLAGGKILESGGVSRVLTHPESEYARKVLKDIPKVAPWQRPACENPAPSD